jgi:hypothetical protein
MNDGRMVSPGKTARRRKWSAIGLVLLLVIGLAWWNEQNIRIWASFELWRQMPLPDFDSRKATKLSQERRAEWERELFTEVTMWNDQSRRYHGPSGTLERELRWRAMAKEGFELAYLALMIYEPSSGRMQRPLPALERLDELARQADAGAMCLYTAIATKLPERGGIDWASQEARARFWMQKGVELGHPACLIQLGARLQSGIDGFVQDVPRGRAMLYQALSFGYLGAAGTLRNYFDAQGLDSARNRQLVYCWGYQAARIRFTDADLFLRVHRNRAPSEQRPLLEYELREFKKWHPVIEECIDLTNQIQGG